MKKMKEIYSKLFIKDACFKILSLVIAIGLWLMVINIENPMEIRGYSIPITFENQEVIETNGFILSNQEELDNLHILVKIRGQRLTLDRITRNDLKATVDLQNVVNMDDSTEEGSFPVEITLPTFAESVCTVQSKQPSEVPLSVEKITSGEKKIEAVIKGQAASGFFLQTAEITPATVTVTGAKSAIQKVSTVKVDIDVTNAQSDVYIYAVPIAYDEHGTPVEGVSMNADKVIVNLPIRQNKTIAIKISSQGQPAEGYELSELQYTPKSIVVTGNESVLQRLSEITLPPLEIEGTKDNIKQTFQIASYLPSGVSLKNASDADVVVEAVVAKPVQKDISIKASQISLVGTAGETLTAELRAKDGTLAVRGANSTVAGLEADKILGTADCTGLAPGTHMVPVIFQLPQGIQLAGSTMEVEIVVTSTEVETPPEEPEESKPVISDQTEPIPTDDTENITPAEEE